MPGPRLSTQVGSGGLGTDRPYRLAERAALQEPLFDSEDASEFVVSGHQGRRWSAYPASVRDLGLDEAGFV